MDGGPGRLNASLQRRLALALVLCIGVVALVAGAFSFAAAYDEARELQDDVLLQVALLVDRQRLDPVPAAPDAHFKAHDDGTRVIVQRLGAVDPAGRHVDDGGVLPIPPTLADGLHTLELGGESFRVLVRTTAAGTRIAVAQESDLRDELAQGSALLTLLPFLVLVPVLLLLVARLVRTMFGPITALAQQVDARAEHDLQPMATHGLPTEVRPFVGAINRLLARVAHWITANPDPLALAPLLQPTAIGVPALAALVTLIVIWVVLATLLGLAAFAWRLPDTPSPPARHSQQPFMATLRQPVMRRVYLVTVLMAVAHGPYYAFYSIGLKAHGWQASQIGWLWTLGVLAEITAFWWMPRILARVSLAQLLRFGLLMAVLRFAVIAALPDVPAVMMAMQLLHAFTFATHHTASIGLIHQAAPPEHQAKSQGLYWVLGYGLGGGIGGLAAGALWPHGQMLAAFGLSCAAALLGWLCALRWPTSVQQARTMPSA